MIQDRQSIANQNCANGTQTVNYLTSVLTLLHKQGSEEMFLSAVTEDKDHQVFPFFLRTLNQATVCVFNVTGPLLSHEEQTEHMTDTGSVLGQSACPQTLPLKQATYGQYSPVVQNNE